MAPLVDIVNHEQNACMHPNGDDTIDKTPKYCSVLLPSSSILPPTLPPQPSSCDEINLDLAAASMSLVGIGVATSLLDFETVTSLQRKVRFASLCISPFTIWVIAPGGWVSLFSAGWMHHAGQSPAEVIFLPTMALPDMPAFGSIFTST
mmetsp:Transcript_19559/g.28582  ORF Transcript_19559/g.28582 Transcript_19559/m.28582 type:complete len:149 (+) Transcript_19559:60-506(+)